MKCKSKTYSCTWTEPWENTTSSTSAPTWSNKAWTYKETWTLWACEWRCKSSDYERDWTTMKCKSKTYSCTSEWLYDTYFSNDCYIQKTVGDKTCYKKWCDTWYECYVYNQTIPTWVWSYVVAYGWWIACVKETEWWTRTYEQWGCPNTYTDSCPSDSPAWTSCTAQQKANIAKCCVQKNGQATQYVCK